MAQDPLPAAARRERLAALIAGIEPHLGSFLARQEWCDRSLDPVVVHDAEDLLAGAPGLLTLLASTAAGMYQVVVGTRPCAPGTEAPEPVFVAGQPESVIARIEVPEGPLLAYDALVDPELCAALLDIVTGSPQGAERLRKGRSGERGTSLILDEHFELRVFRRIVPGPNPEAEMITALDEVGFNHLPAPLALWKRGGFDLALALELLSGASDGRALVRTSLRDLYAAGGSPGAAGGDFSAEAERLGNMTARMHVALAKAFGTDPGPGDASAVIRVHGDYDLDHVARSELGWFVHDFGPSGTGREGDTGRRAPALVDVAHMLGAFRSVATAVAEEWSPADPGSVAGLARSWLERNKEAFASGYLDVADVDGVVSERAVRELIRS